MLLVFLLFKFFGGDPAEIMAGLNATPEQVQAIRDQLGLNSPWYVQLWINLKSIVTFDWGRSFATNESVANIFATPAAGDPDGDDPDPDARHPARPADRDVGRLPARLAERPGDHGDQHGGALDLASWSTSSSASTSSASSSAGSRCRAGATRSAKNLVTYVPLPVLLALFVGVAPQTRLYRTFFLDELGHDYVRTARAKGMTEKTVLFKHVLRNAMIPILTNIGLSLPGIFVGSFLIEVFFSIPGLGREVILAVNRSDYPVIQAITVYLAMLTMVINLAGRRALQAGRPAGGAQVRASS